MPAKGCVRAHVTISSEWRISIEYRAPSDTMIAGSHHFSPHRVITFKCTGGFSHQLADDREHHRASPGTVLPSLLSHSSSHRCHPHQSLPDSCLICFWKHLHASQGIFSVVFSIFSSHVFSPYESFIFFFLSHSLHLLTMWHLNSVIYGAGMAGHVCWIYYHLKQLYSSPLSCFKG